MTAQFTAARMALLLLASVVPAVHAAGTAAGTDITNTASATFTDPGGSPVTVSSNTTTLKVDEVLDVTIVANDASNVAVTTPDTDAPLSFTVTNTGNGSEFFSLSVNNALGGDQFDPVNTRLYLDDGDGILEIGAGDTLYVAGSNDPALAADASRIVFMVNDMPAGRSNSDVARVELLAEAITAQATAGADAPGTTFAGQGAGGSDAVVGNTQADASGQNGYVVSLVATTFSKTQTVIDQFGGTNAIPGAEITYTLTFAATGSGSLSGSQITDPIPANTTYVSGSLTLNAGGLTDTADADAGRFTGTGIAVDLGTVTAPVTHAVTFRVTIN